MATNFGELQGLRCGSNDSVTVNPRKRLNLEGSFESRKEEIDIRMRQGGIEYNHEFGPFDQEIDFQLPITVKDISTAVLGTKEDRKTLLLGLFSDFKDVVGEQRFNWINLALMNATSVAILKYVSVAVFNQQASIYEPSFAFGVGALAAMDITLIAAKILKSKEKAEKRQEIWQLNTAVVAMNVALMPVVASLVQNRDFLTKLMS